MAEQRGRDEQKDGKEEKAEDKATSDPPMAVLTIPVEEERVAMVKSSNYSTPAQRTKRRSGLWLGNTLAFCYKNNTPMFTIGPHCIFMVD